MSYSSYVPKWERPVLSALLTACLRDGNTISVYDGEEYVLKRTTSINAVRAVLGAAEEDQLTIRNTAGDAVGWFWLIYNNGSEGDPMVVIADCTANDFCEQICNDLSAKYDQ